MRLGTLRRNVSSTRLWSTATPSSPSSPSSELWAALRLTLLTPPGRWVGMVWKVVLVHVGSILWISIYVWMDGHYATSFWQGVADHAVASCCLLWLAMFLQVLQMVFQLFPALAMFLSYCWLYQVWIIENTTGRRLKLLALSLRGRLPTTALSSWCGSAVAVSLAICLSCSPSVSGFSPNNAVVELCHHVTRDVAVIGVTVNPDKNVVNNDYRFHFKSDYYRSG